jgi:acetyl/propionyl-CoA carboxylase alpha subunit
MFNDEVLNEFFIWEEKNLTELKNNCLNNTEFVHYDTTTKIKNDSIKKDWTDITDPKLRKKMRDKAWRKANKNKVKENNKTYYKINKDKSKNNRKNYYASNKDKIKVQTKAYREVNKEKIKNWRVNNKDKIKVYNKEYESKRRILDPVFKLNRNLRIRLNTALKNNYKSGSAVRDLGCTIEELKVYLESKFQPGMTWSNYGMYGWHIDHIKPLSSFDLSDRNQFLEACHYTNLQPLWAQDNLTKSNKLI